MYVVCFTIFRSVPPCRPHLLSEFPICAFEWHLLTWRSKIQPPNKRSHEMLETNGRDKNIGRNLRRLWARNINGFYSNDKLDEICQSFVHIKFHNWKRWQINNERLSHMETLKWSQIFDLFFAIFHVNLYLCHELRSDRNIWLWHDPCHLAPIYFLHQFYQTLSALCKPTSQTATDSIAAPTT